MEPLPLIVMDEFLAELDTFGGRIVYDSEIVRLKGGKLECITYIKSSEHKGYFQFYRLETKRFSYLTEVFCSAIRSGYRICDNSRVLRSCLLSLSKSDYAKDGLAKVLGVEEVKTLFKAKK